MLFDFLTGSAILYGAFITVLMFAPLILVVGYGYVVLVNLIYVIYYVVWRLDDE